MARKHKATAKADEGERILVRNKRAVHDYRYRSDHEAGIALVGSEVKSLRDRARILMEGYIGIRGGEAWLVNITHSNGIPWANRFNHEPKRRRKLLMNSGCENAARKSAIVSHTA